MERECKAPQMEVELLLVLLVLLVELEEQEKEESRTNVLLLYPASMPSPVSPVCPRKAPTINHSRVSVTAKFDFTPPQNITLLVSDLEVLTPSAVSEELIKLYLDQI